MVTASHELLAELNQSRMVVISGAPEISKLLKPKLTSKEG